jgi:ficolin
LTIIVDVYNNYLYSVVGDSLTYNNGDKFTTLDQNNDKNVNTGNCAVDRHGAWWYRYCTWCNLNGDYGGPRVSGNKYNYWYDWKRNKKSLKATMMLIKPQ